jgi:hypothetical protein
MRNLKKMDSTTIVEKLDKYGFHDMVVESINFYSDKEIQLIVTALPYNDNSNQYEKLRLIFSEIIEMRTDEFILVKDSELELNSFDYEYNGHFYCKLIFLLGFGNPSMTIDLKCNKIELEE